MLVTNMTSRTPFKSGQVNPDQNHKEDNDSSEDKKLEAQPQITTGMPSDRIQELQACSVFQGIASSSGAPPVGAFMFGNQLQASMSSDTSASFLLQALARGMPPAPSRLNSDASQSLSALHSTMPADMERIRQMQLSMAISGNSPYGVPNSMALPSFSDQRVLPDQSRAAANSMTSAEQAPRPQPALYPQHASMLTLAALQQYQRNLGLQGNLSQPYAAAGGELAIQQQLGVANEASIVNANFALASTSVASAAAANPAGTSSTGNVDTPKTKPKRPLSAYNMFFKDERAKLLASLPSIEDPTTPKKGRRRRRNATHGKISFEEMAKEISKKWKEVDPVTKETYQKLASAEKHRYEVEKEQYIQSMQEGVEAQFEKLESTIDEETMKQYLESGGGVGPKKRRKRKEKDDSAC